MCTSLNFDINKVTTCNHVILYKLMFRPRQHCFHILGMFFFTEFHIMNAIHTTDICSQKPMILSYEQQVKWPVISGLPPAMTSIISCQSPFKRNTSELAPLMLKVCESSSLGEMTAP